MSAPTVAEAEAVNFETAFHLDKDVASEDPENYLVIHELMGRGQLLNAYDHPAGPAVLTDLAIHGAAQGQVVTVREKVDGHHSRPDRTEGVVALPQAELGRLGRHL